VKSEEEGDIYSPLSAGRSKMWKRLEDLGFKTYSDYLNGPHWKEFRRGYRAAGYSMLCVVCGTCYRIQLHHVTYQRLGCEIHEDVRPLCEDHHKEVHACLKAEKLKVSSTDDVVERLKAGERFDLTDILQKWGRGREAVREPKGKKGSGSKKKRKKQKQKSPSPAGTVPQLPRPKNKKVKGKKAKKKARKVLQPYRPPEDKEGDRKWVVARLRKEHAAGHMTLSVAEMELLIKNAKTATLRAKIHLCRKLGSPPVDWLL
jgi:hypothetical protein